MVRKKNKPKLTFADQFLKIKKAGLAMPLSRIKRAKVWDELEDLNTRITKILHITQPSEKFSAYMTYFIMYDIEDNKIRRLISKFLINKGCTRIQKSVFLAHTSREVYNEIHQALKEVNQMYDNSDSILITPVASDELRAMKIIGQNIDLSIATRGKNTLIF